MPSPIEMTARHFANLAPSSRYSFSRSRSPSRPSVIVSSGALASGFAPRSTLIPGMTPCCSSTRGTASRRERTGGSSRRKDHAADVVGRALGREEHVAVRAAALLGGLDPDRVEALLDRARALVGGEDALPRRDERSCGLVQISHRRPPESWFRRHYRRSSTALSLPHADVAQLVEHQLPKLRVAGSNPVVRSIESPAQAGF